MHIARRRSPWRQPPGPAAPQTADRGRGTARHHAATRRNDEAPCERHPRIASSTLAAARHDPPARPRRLPPPSHGLAHAPSNLSARGDDAAILPRDRPAGRDDVPIPLRTLRVAPGRRVRPAAQPGARTGQSMDRRHRHGVTAVRSVVPTVRPFGTGAQPCGWPSRLERTTPRPVRPGVQPHRSGVPPIVQLLNTTMQGRG